MVFIFFLFILSTNNRMDYTPHRYKNQNGMQPSFKHLNKRSLWFNSDFNSDFLIADGVGGVKITDITFDVNPFEIYKFNRLKVFTYIRDTHQSRPIQIKLKTPLSQSRDVINSDKESYPIIYNNHTGARGIHYNDQYSLTLTPQQIRSFTFRLDDNINSFLSSSGTDVIYRIFNYTGTIQTFNVPTGVSSVNVYCWGAGGGSSRAELNTTTIRGGNGGFVKATLTIPSGTTSLGIIVGQGGSKGSITGSETTRTAFGGGGSGVNNYIGWGLGGGGGLSGVFINDANFSIIGGYYVNTSATAIIIAGGGGGAGGYSVETGDTHGGSGGFTTANDGSGNRPGGGGSQLTGGTAGTANGYAQGTAGSKYLGGNGAAGSFNPGGGGGYFGGGAGGVEPGKVSGGGGGSSFVNTISYKITNITNLKNTTNGTAIAVGNTETYYKTGIALGGLTATSSTTTNDGANGLVVIEYFSNRIEGITPEETLIQATNSTIPVNINSKYQINYQPPVNINKGTYETIFSNGSITFKSKPDFNYPITSNNPINWYKFDDSQFLYDSSGNNHLIDKGATLDTNNYIRGSGSLSVAQNKFAEIGGANINFYDIQTTKGISFSVWVKLTGGSAYGRIFHFSGANQSTDGMCCICRNLGTTGIQLNLWTTESNRVIVYDSSYNYFNNTWYHLTWTISSSGVWSYYVNGSSISITSTTFSFDSSKSYNTSRLIGNSIVNDFLIGNIDDFRIFDYVLSPIEVYDLYNGNTDRSYPILRDAINMTIDPIVWYKFDSGSLTQDSSGNGYNLTNNNNVNVDKSNFLKGDGSALFNPSTSCYFTMPKLNYNTINTTNGISFSFWGRFKSTSGNFAAVIQSQGGVAGSHCLIYRDGNDIAFYNEIPAPYSWKFIRTSGINNFDNTWRFYTWTISTTGIWNVYINGVVTNANFSGNIIPTLLNADQTYTTSIGRRLDTNHNIDGNIDDFRIYGKVLTSTEVSELYNGRVSIYNPPGFILGVDLEDHKLKLTNTISTNNRNDS